MYEQFGATFCLISTDSSLVHKKLKKRRQRLIPAAIYISNTDVIDSTRHNYVIVVSTGVHYGWCTSRAPRRFPNSVVFGQFSDNARRKIGCQIRACVSHVMLLLCREVAMNEKLIVQMDGKRTRIFNTKVDKSRVMVSLLLSPRQNAQSITAASVFVIFFLNNWDVIFSSYETRKPASPLTFESQKYMRLARAGFGLVSRSHTIVI